MSSRQALLRELESLPHAARMRRVVELGRTAAVDKNTAAILDEWERGNFYERLLALQSCYGSGNGVRALRMLSDPSRILRSKTLRLIALFADDVEARQALHTIRANQRLSLLSHLRRRGRFAPIDAFLEEIAVRDPATLSKLLPFGSTDIMARHFDVGRQHGGLHFWRRAARFHPTLAAQRLGADLDAVPQADFRLVWEANAVLDTLAKRHPEQALAVLNRLTRHVALGQIALARMALRRPAAVADLLLASPDQVSLDLHRGVPHLDPPRLLALLERRPGTLTQPAFWLRRLRPSQRASVFRIMGHAWRDGLGCVPVALLRHLPRSEREAEARRHLALPELATRPAMRLPYSGLLPWEETRRHVEPFLNHPEADLRGLALQALTASVRYERSRASELLALARARRHEQDPVRCALLTGLMELPPSVWQPEHLTDLGQVIRDALSAADLSHATARLAEQLVVALLPFHPDWSAGWLVTLVRERGQVYLGSLEDRLTDADVRRLAPALRPVLEAWQTREREPQLVLFAQSFGRRLRVFDELLEVLERLLDDTKHSWVASSILTLIAEHRRSRLPELIPQLLRDDPSWITQPPVLHYLHRHRQDLLTPFLGRRAYAGRFSTGKTRYVLPLQTGFLRWTLSQQTTFAATLTK